LIARSNSIAIGAQGAADTIVVEVGGALVCGVCNEYTLFTDCFDNT